MIDIDIGIDGLKEVNDTFGYDVGTICSAEAHRLRDRARNHDVCVRSPTPPRCRWCPSTVAVPDVALVSPTRIRMVVDFPAPLGPRNPVTRPG